MEWELAHLVRMVDAPVPDGSCAYVAELEGQRLVLAYCGMGMVSAAAGASAMIARYAPRAVLNYGCAGAHRPELLPGDIVVATRLVAYENTRETPAGEVRYTGMLYLVDGEQRRVQALPTDSALLEAARGVAAHPVEAWPADLAWPASIEHRPAQVVFGTVLSADRWNRAPASIQRLVEQHDSFCEDMEAAAIALVCASAQVPFLAVKDISNNELLRATAGGQAMFEELGAEQLARRAAIFTLAVLHNVGV
jgi:adenosylhomocysteine nucleosidase